MIEHPKIGKAISVATDTALFDAVRATDDGFRIPAAVAHAILDGEHPVKAWRDQRGLTQEALAEQAGISKADLWTCMRPIKTRSRKSGPVRHVTGSGMIGIGNADQAGFERLVNDSGSLGSIFRGNPQ